MSDIDQVQERYLKRQQTGIAVAQSQYTEFIHLARADRELWATLFLRKHLGERLSRSKVLEIGAGHGDNVHFLMRAGFSWSHIFLNELLPDRVESLKQWFPQERTYAGDILKTQTSEKFDVIYQSTVFSSILDPKLYDDVLAFCSQHLSPQGYFLWYDFCFDNPKNKDVRGISRAEAVQLFENNGYKLVEGKKVTLAPPIGRRVGGWYNFFNTLLPFLRTHQVLLFQKRSLK